ncbi:MAG: hypothetical protein AB7D05_07725, partial [Mangrovibacterium sp.]
RPIVFEGGKVYFNSDWYFCNTCGCWFNHPEKDIPLNGCSLCGSKSVVQYREPENGAEKINMLICPSCGKGQRRSRSRHKQIVCPDCRRPLVGEL